MTYEIYEKYIKCGWILFEVNEDKTPKVRTFKGMKDSMPYAPNALYAGIPPTHILVIDVDIKADKNGVLKRGDESFDKLKKALGIEYISPNVQTRSGGSHYYVYIDSHKPVINKNQSPAYPDIDFIQNDGSNDRYVLLGGQKLSDGSEYIFYNLKPNSEIRKYIYGIGLKYKFISNCESSELEFCEDEKFHVPLSDEQIAKCLEYIDYDSYDPWIKVGMILKNERHEHGLRIFNEWSARSHKYPGEHEVTSYFNRLSIMEDGLRYASLVNMALEVKYDNVLNALLKVQKPEDIVGILDSHEMKQFPFLSKKSINRIKNDFAKYVKNRRLKVEFNKVIDKYAPCTKDASEAESELLKYIRISGRGSTKNGCFYDMTKGHAIDERTVKTLCNDALAQISTARECKYSINDAINEGLIRTAYYTDYNPREPERFFYSENAEPVYNLFHINSLPRTSQIYTNEGMRYVEYFIRHIRITWGEYYSDIFLSYLAYIVQNLGDKVFWMPVFQSFEGIGKTIIFKIVANHLLGNTNCASASMSDLRSEFNTWAFDKLLILIEELKICPINERHIANNLKTFVTNDRVKKLQKYYDSIEVDNRMNYMAFTNEHFPMPIAEDSRRYFVVKSPIKSIDQLELATGISYDEYFKPLVALSKSDCEFGSELRKYFTEYEVSSAFTPHRLPKSEFTDEIIRMSKNYCEKT